MVPLPLFKLAALFVRHISKYGANHIKHQAHVHPRFRAFAANYGQMIHQLNMRLSVALLRNVDAEAKAREAKEKAEAPTVKTEEQIKKEEEIRAKYGTTAKESHPVKEPPKSIWRRKFRSLPEAKAVDLFADVIGDAFILLVATALIMYETIRQTKKPDANLERIKDLDARLEELKKREKELEEAEKNYESRIQTIEEALRAVKDPKTKKPILPTPTPMPTPSPATSPAA
ncbi:OPA3-like protein [Coniochaeta hoffmannii]|uniref:OPA3-like protein n=1 Tax=Coniochaeta hoffmannii TaxID=91930 RepID=A0AA38VPK2_9PEZI|nr:OPA3-like protein [Coniochaeta hoffmannii]